MITQWTLYNFKSIRDETTLKFAPLTILAGANSSGKSSLLQSILLISQTLSSKVSSRSVILNGPLTRLGQFDDLHSFQSDSDQVYIEMECEPRPDVTEAEASARSRFANRLRSATCSISFEADKSSGLRNVTQLQPRLFGVQLVGVMGLEDGTNSISAFFASRAAQPEDKLSDFSDQARNVISEAHFASLNYDIELNGDALQEFQERFNFATIAGCAFRHFLPTHLTLAYDRVRQQAAELTRLICEPRYATTVWKAGRNDLKIPTQVMQLLKQHLGDKIPRLFELMPREMPLLPPEASHIAISEWNSAIRTLSSRERIGLSQVLDELHNEIYETLVEQRSPEYALTQERLPADLNSAANYLESLFTSKVKYLGPLRDEPKALYPLATNVDPAEVGLRGEYTAAVLDLHKAARVRYLPTANFPVGKAQETVIRRAPSVRTLESAVNDWLQYMDVAERIETIDQGKLGHELKVYAPEVGMAHDLTHVGVGVSQVLPILVMCLLAEPDTTLIIEQPELHLHPKVQTLLGDFFLSMAMLGKQIIVETHSEYIINRLRFRAAAATRDEVSQLLKIYFAEKKNGASVFREVNVNQYGAVVDWPEGFFDQSQAEAEEILRAATRKHKAEREGKQNAQRND